MSGESTVGGGGVGSERTGSGPDVTGVTRATGVTGGVTRTAAGAGGGGGVLPPGTRFGRYEIVRLIGSGGMGAVYEAQQESPRRSVALKVIRGSWLSAQLLRRFEHESQVLGRLQHPGIAQVYEAGSVKDERGETTPFFAMELIKGVPLTEYAAAKQLGTRERLELVARICDAVYHAHQKGVIHRDLKPGNILVDEAGQPKVLDFGVARATDSDIQQTTMQTDIGQLIGTVPYMSPEQVSGDPNELDTRSDVYALGVIAYELLAGRLPYDLQKKMIHEAVRVIREEDPTRLSSLNRTLRGDIETIVAKALEKEKARRYQSAEALGSDIRRYLKDEPISARPASTWYQAGKFARRNKVLVGGIAATFLVLIAGIIGVSMMLKRALEAEHDLGLQIGETNAALTKAREAEKETAKRADELQKVSDFQEKMLAQVDPTTAGVWLTEDVTKKLAAALEKAGVAEEERQAQVDAFRQQWVKVNATDAATQLIDRTILRPAVKAIDEQFKDQPLVEAQLKQVLADRYTDLGLYEQALPLHEGAAGIYRRELGEDHATTFRSIGSLGDLLWRQRKLDEVEVLFKGAVERSRRVLGEDHPETVRAINSMGTLLQDMGNPGEAEKCYREAMEKSRRILGEDHADTLVTVNNVGHLLQEQGRLAEAEPYFSEVLERRLRLDGEEHPDTLTSISNMGVLLHDQGKYAEAEALYRKALEKRRRVLGEEHPDTLTSINNMGSLLQDQGKYADAEALYREALEKRRRVLGEDHIDTLQSINAVGYLLYSQGKLGEAEPYWREALEKRRRVLGEEHQHTLGSISNMGTLLQDQGKLAEAEPYVQEALQKSRRVLGEEHPQTLIAINSMGFVLRKQGKYAEAEAYYREAVETGRRVLGEEHTNTLIFLTNLGIVLRMQGKLAEAEPYWREAMETGRRVLGDMHPYTLIFIAHMGELLYEQGKATEAVQMLAPIEEPARAAHQGSNAIRLAGVLKFLGLARAKEGFEAQRFAAAESNLQEAHRVFSEPDVAAEKDARDCAMGLVELYNAWHAAEPGKGYDAKAAEWKAKLRPAETPAQPKEQESDADAP